MTRLNPSWIVALWLALAASCTSAGAQIFIPSESQGIVKANRDGGVARLAADEYTYVPALRSVLLQAQTSRLKTSTQNKTRSRRIAIGIAVGGIAGAVAGEHLLGRRMDLPHGPDMLLGAAIGAGLGALLAAGSDNSSDPPQSRSSLRLLPVLSPSRKSLFVAIALRGP